MIVSNSTPLINFAAIDRLDIPETLFTTLTIPPAVEHELLERGHLYPSMTGIRQAAFIVKHNIRNVLLRDALSIDLDAGEAEAITLALEHKADLLLLDEIAGRMIAESHQLAFTGSIGCLIEAKQAGIIPAVKPLLDAMRQEARFWVNPRLYARILAEQGEWCRRWPRRSCWRGYASQLRIGGGRDEDGEFMAHAWVEYDGRALVGAAGVAQYTPFPMPLAHSNPDQLKISPRRAPRSQRKN